MKDMKKILMMLAILMIVIVGVLSGCIANDESNDTPFVCEEETEECRGFDLYKCYNNEWHLLEQNCEDCGYVPPEPEPEYDDVIFHRRLSDIIAEIQLIEIRLKTAMDSKNFYSLATIGAEKEKLADDYKEEIVAYYLSYDYSRLRDEFYEYLDDYGTAGYYLRKSGTSKTSGASDSTVAMYLNLASEYIEKSTVHLNKCTQIMGEIND